MSRMKIKGSVTIDDMYHMPKDGQKCELVDGNLVVSPEGAYHGEIVINIAGIIPTFSDNFHIS